MFYCIISPAEPDYDIAKRRLKAHEFKFQTRTQSGKEIWSKRVTMSTHPALKQFVVGRKSVYKQERIEWRELAPLENYPNYAALCDAPD